ncbi:MAG: hypothetical protein H0X51_07195 [Parachlamydiaceae bacterium]|nr:hypothetical protein [Parachlamydiaceae bacterium]
MKNKFVCLLFIVLSVFCLQVSAKEKEKDVSDIAKQIRMLQSEMEANQNDSKSDKSELKNAVIKANVQYIEGCIVQKIKRVESRLEKVKARLAAAKADVDEDDFDSEAQSKKIEALQKRLMDLREVALMMEMFKMRLED